MPTYDYFCAQCTHEFEAFHGMNDVLKTCPECGQDALRRKIGTGAGLIFKGSGFYQTDYKPSGGGGFRLFEVGFRILQFGTSDRFVQHFHHQLRRLTL